MVIVENWKSLIKPERLHVESESLTTTYGKFIAEPLERGFGITMGNAIRRILLSSIQGAAITSVRIEGVQHEFTTIQGVTEDVPEIVLNIKGIRLKIESTKTKELSINVVGPKEVTAKDIETDSSVEVLNPNHHIATLNKDGKFNAILTVKMGKGYIPAEKNKTEDMPVGTIPVDSIFTPIKRVSYSIGRARMGEYTDYDKLTLEVWTDGSLRPEDAVAYASKILQDQLAIFINFEVSEEEESAVPVTKIHGDIAVENLMKSVDDLELSVRAQNCLRNANIKTIKDLVLKSEPEMLKTKNFGRKSLQEIKNVLMDMGLRLGMKVEDLPSHIQK
ncbi:MAG TPA: DNA-directed RNA polymerase subunit alpha [bacterium]